MGYKIFVSYKYADSDVERLMSSEKNLTTVRDYVDLIEERIKNNLKGSVYKGESDGEDLSALSEDTIWEKLKDRIYDSSVTFLFVSPCMVEKYVTERGQWIPWEIAYSVREQERHDRTSHSNAIVAIVLPDADGSYAYYDTMRHFKIVNSNIANGYIEVVYWNNFTRGITYYIERAIARQKKVPKSEIDRSVD